MFHTVKWMLIYSTALQHCSQQMFHFSHLIQQNQFNMVVLTINRYQSLSMLRCGLTVHISMVSKIIIPTGTVSS